jgi:eukaryotic-like serine/threonine-protein kinase
MIRACAPQADRASRQSAGLPLAQNERRTGIGARVYWLRPTSMAPERWQQINQVFYDALARPAAARADFLAQACGADEELRQEVLTLLAADAKPAALLEEPLGVVAAALWSDLPSTAPLPAALSGTELGGYQIIRSIGRGGMGEVYLAQDQKLDRRVALKLLPAHFTHDPERLHRFRQEARAASALNHPNIVTIFDIGQEHERHFMATEFVAGQTLRAALQHERFAQARALDIAIQIASALEAAHQAGIIHRDIKPENVMLRPDGYVKVLDFGLAKLTEPGSANRRKAGGGTTRGSSNHPSFETRSGVVLGTVNYMSPEQARGQKVDVRTDLFSLGVTLYEMLTGEQPFAGPTPNHVLVAILDQAPPPLIHYLADAAPALQPVLSRMLAKDREQRYSSAHDLLFELRALKDELASAAHAQRANTSGALSETALDAPAPRRRLGVVSALVVGLALILGAAFALSKWLSPPPTAPPFAQYQATKFTAYGNIPFGVISPNGKYVAYGNNGTVRLSDQKTPPSIFIQQIAGGGRTVIWSSPNDGIWGMAFSPDSNYLYYVVDRADGELYRVPVLGGTPRLLLKQISTITNSSFSPDGREIVYAVAAKLRIAAADGSQPRDFASFPQTTRLWGLAWSPDGQRIVYAVRDYQGGNSNLSYLAERPVSGGAERIIIPHKRQIIRSPLWLPDGQGMLILMATPETGTDQLYHSTYPEGRLRRITQDANNYRFPSLTADGRTLLVSQNFTFSGIWVAPLNDPQQAKQVTPNMGFYGDVAWTPSNQLIYTSFTNNAAHLWQMKEDGTETRQLSAAEGSESQPTVSADGRYIVFVSTRTGRSQIWRMDADGSNQVQLTTEGGTLPTITPDGQWVIYEVHLAGNASLWKVPLQGGTPTLFAAAQTRNPGISPDGKLVACFAYDAPTQPNRIVLIPSDGGAPVKSFATMVGHGSILWTPDGRALIYCSREGQREDQRILLQPLAGGPPKILHQLTNERFLSVALSPDGKQLAWSIGRDVSDLVLLSEVK